MAIQRLSIKGLLSIKEVTWLPGSLNLLVGPNGSGKSNLLRVLELISDTARGKLRDAVSQFGGVVPLLWDQGRGPCGWQLKIDPVDENRDKLRDAVTYELELQQVRQTSSYEVVKDTLGLDHWLSKYRLGGLFTSGELDLVTAPDVERGPEEDSRLNTLGPEPTPT